MTGAYRCTDLKITATVNGLNYICDVVTAFDCDFSYEGGSEPVYGQRSPKHSAGSKAIKFALTRMFYADSGNESLFLDLFTGEDEFTLTTNLIDKSGVDIAGTAVQLIDCRVYNYKPIMGNANDVLGEQISGEGLNWDLSGVVPTPTTNNLEGNYTTWVYKYKLDCGHQTASNVEDVEIYNNGTVIFTGNSTHLTNFVDLSGNVTTVATLRLLINVEKNSSVLKKYFVGLTTSDNNGHLVVYSDSTLLFDRLISLDVTTITNAGIDVCVISPNGKYIVAIYTESGMEHNHIALYEGVP
jgi:hypothetical protein